MDKSAVYVAFFTLALVAVLSGLTIFVRRLIQNPEKRATEPELSPTHTVLYLAGAAVILFLLITIPLVGFGLLIAVFVWGILSFARMPAEKKELLHQSMAEHNQKPLVKFANCLTLVMMIILILYMLWSTLE